MKTIKISLFIFYVLLAGLLNAQDKDKEAIRAFRDAEKDFKKKNYAGCLTDLAIALNGTPKKKQLEEAEEMLPIAYNGLFDSYKSSIATLEKSVEQYAGLVTINTQKQIIDNYSFLIGIQTKVQSIPQALLSKCGILEKTKDDYVAKHEAIRIEYEKTIERYVDEQYELGEEALAQNNKPRAQFAHKCFREVKKFKQTYKELDAKMKEAKEKGTYKVVIGNFENISGVISNERLKDRLMNELNDELRKTSTPESALFFMEIIPMEATLTASISKMANDANKLKNLTKENAADFVLFGNIISATTSISEIKSSSQSRAERVVIDKVQKIVDGKKVMVDVYGDVKAEFYTYDQSKSASVVGDLTIYYASTAQYIRKNEKVNGGSYDAVIWHKYTGDGRALNKYEAEKMKQGKGTFKSDEYMVNDALGSLVASIKSSLNSVLNEINAIK